jgi:hypothetical protein
MAFLFKNAPWTANPQDFFCPPVYGRVQTDRLVVEALEAQPQRRPAVPMPAPGDEVLPSQYRRRQTQEPIVAIKWRFSRDHPEFLKRIFVKFDDRKRDVLVTMGDHKPAEDLKVLCLSCVR